MRGEFLIHRTRGAYYNHHLACLHSSFLFDFQLNLSPCLSLFHALPPIKPLRGVWPSRCFTVPGSSVAPSSDEEVWTIGLGWIGLATSNDSLTHVVNNSRGGKKKNKHTQSSRWEGQHGHQQFVATRQEGGSYSSFLSRYHISMPVCKCVIVSGWSTGHSFLFMKSNVTKCYLNKTHRWNNDRQENTVLLPFIFQLSTLAYICALSITFPVSLWRNK